MAAKSQNGQWLRGSMSALARISLNSYRSNARERLASRNLRRSCCENPAPQRCMDMQRISYCAFPMTSSALRRAQSTQNHSIESVNASKSMKTITKRNSHGCAPRCSVSYSIGKNFRSSIRTRSSFRRFECRDGSAVRTHWPGPQFWSAAAPCVLL